MLNHIEHGAAGGRAGAGRSGAGRAGTGAGAPPRQRRRLPPAPRGPAAAAPGGARRRRPGQRDESVKLSKIRTLTGDHMLMSLATSPHAFSVVEVDYANVDRSATR